MQRILFTFLAFSLFFARARGGPLDVPTQAREEILRRGNMVEHIVPGMIRDDGISTYGQIAGPPEDDSHKWFITVVSTPGCGYCTRLKNDWSSSPDLLAFGRPGDDKNSWSHLGFYSYADATQKWRWTNVKFSGFPTIIIQPPLNGRYGNPKTVVAQITGYNGNPKALADDMRSRFIFYLEKFQEKRRGVEKKLPAPKGFGQLDDEAIKSIGQEKIGVDPPFEVPPKVDPVNPSPGPLGPVGPPPSPNDAPRPKVDPKVDPDDVSVGMILKLLAKLVLGFVSGGTLESLLQTAGILAIVAFQYLKHQMLVKEKKNKESAAPAPAPAPQ